MHTSAQFQNNRIIVGAFTSIQTNKGPGAQRTKTLQKQTSSTSSGRFQVTLIQILSLITLLFLCRIKPFLDIHLSHF